VWFVVILAAEMTLIFFVHVISLWLDMCVYTCDICGVSAVSMLSQVFTCDRIGVQVNSINKTACGGD
jgi:hypothetical protein